MASDTELKKTLDELTKAIKGLASGRNSSSSGGRDPASRGAGDPAANSKRKKSKGEPDFTSLSKGLKSYEDALEDAIKKSNRLSSDMSAAYKDFGTEFAKLGKVTSKSADDLDKINSLYKQHSGYMSAMLDSDKLSNKAQDALLGKLKDVSSNFDDLGGNLAKNIKGMGMMAEFINSNTDSLIELNKVIKDNVDVNEDNVEQVTKNISSLKDLAEENKLTSKTISTVTKAQKELKDITKEHSDKLVNLGYATADQLSSSKDIVNAYKKQLDSLDSNSAQYKDAKVDLELFMTSIQKTNIKITDAAKAEAKTRDSFAQSTRGATQAIVDHETKYAPLNKALQSVKDEFRGFSLEAIKAKITLGAGLALMLEGVKKLYGEFTAVAQAGLAQNFAVMAGSAIKLGIKLDSLTKIVDANYNAYSKMGMDKFASTLSTNRDALMKLGLSSEQAAKANGEMITNAQSSGVNVKNTKDLNDSVAQQTDAFKTMRAITGETADQFNANLKGMINSEAIGNQLLGLSKKERNSRIADLMQQQQHYRLLGLTNEETQRALDAQASKGTMDTGERMGGSYKLQAFATQLGMGADDSKRLQVLTNKTQLTDAEKDEKTKLMGTFNDAFNAAHQTAEQDQSKNGKEGPLASLNARMADLMKNQMAAGEMNTAQNVSKADAKGLAQSKEDVDKNKAVGTLSDGQVAAVKAVETAINAMSTGIIVLLTGIGITLLSIRSVLAKSSIGDVASKLFGKAGAVESAGGKVAGAAGKAAGWTTSLGAAAGGAGEAAGAAGGIGGGLAKAGGALMGAGKFALKAVPVIGWAIAAFEGITGAMDGVAKAGEIFGTKTATASQKTAAGIAGALNSLSFGLIPVDSTAKLIDGITGNFGKFLTDAVDGFTTMMPKAFEWVANTAIPKLWSMMTDGLTGIFTGLFKVFDWSKGGGLSQIGDSISSILSGTGRNSLLTKILGYVSDAFVFLGTALIKGISSILLKAFSGLYDMLPSFMHSKAIDGMLSEMQTTASSATTFGNKEERDKTEKASDSRKAADAKANTSSVGGATASMMTPAQAQAAGKGNNVGNIGNLSASDSAAYAAAVAKRESGGNIGVVNSLGYAGKYQFGADALADNGILDKNKVKAMKASGMKNKDIMSDDSVWLNQGGRSAFLSNESLQDATFANYTNKNLAGLKRSGTLTDASSKEDTAGYLMAAHLKGVGGANRLARGDDNADAYGTKASDYYKIGSNAVKNTDTPGTHVASNWNRTPTAPKSQAATDADVANNKIQALIAQGYTQQEANELATTGKLALANPSGAGNGAWVQDGSGIQVFQPGASQSTPSAQTQNGVNVNPAVPPASTTSAAAQPTASTSGSSSTSSVGSETVRLLQIIADNTSTMKNNALNGMKSKSDVFAGVFSYTDNIKNLDYNGVI